MCPLAFSAGGGDPDGPGPGGGVGEPACGGKGGGREEEEEDEEEEEEDEEEEEEEDEEEERHHSPVPVCACGPGNRRRPGLAPKRGSVTRSGACVLCRGPADRTGRGKDGASRTEHGSPVVETGVCPTGRGFGSRCDVRKPWPLKRAHAGAAAVQREISSGSSCPSSLCRTCPEPCGIVPDQGFGGKHPVPLPPRQVDPSPLDHQAGKSLHSLLKASTLKQSTSSSKHHWTITTERKETMSTGRAADASRARRQSAGACGPGGRRSGRLVDPAGPPPPPGPGGRDPGRAVRAAGGPGGWSTRQGPRHLPGPAAETRGVRSGRPAGRAAGRPGRAPATAPARRQSRAGRLVDPPRRGRRGERKGHADARVPSSLSPPAGTGQRDGTHARTRASAATGSRRRPPGPARPPRARGPRGRPATAPDSRPRHASPPVPRPSPRARTRGGEAEEGARHPEAGRRRQGRPPSSPLLSSHVGPRPLRGGRRAPPPPPTGARGRGHAAARPRRGGAPAEGRERESERPRPGRSDKPLCRGLTFNRSQRGSCSATYETPTQKQVVYEWFSTRCPTNVRCVTGEGAAAFPAAPRVPGRRALRTGPRSRRAAGARRAAAPAGGGTRATARRRGRRGTGYPRPTEAPAALPYRSAWAGF
ncbi:hypothetical protein ABFV05_018964 [Capra hircus]